MAGYRRIPNDLALRERPGRPWIVDFLFDLDLDERHDSIPCVVDYARRYDVNRSVIRRLMAARCTELTQATPTRQANDTQTTGSPNKIKGLLIKGDTHATGKRQANDTPIQETETGDGDIREEKNTLCPEPLTDEILQELRFRCSLRFPDEDATRHLGRIERARDARLDAKVRRCGDVNWIRNLWGYIDQVERSERLKEHLPPPEAMAVLKARHKAKQDRQLSLRIVTSP